MGNPFVDALIGFGGLLRGGYAPAPYCGGGYAGGWRDVFSYCRQAYTNPYAYHNYLGNMAYNCYDSTRMDANAYRWGEYYDYNYNMMGMQLYPQNYRAYNFGGKTHFVYNPDAGCYDRPYTFNNPQVDLQRQRSVVESGSKLHINMFKQYRDRQMQVLTSLEGYAKQLKDCGEKEKAKEVQAKIDELKKVIEAFDKSMAEACDGKDLSTQEVLYATDAVLKEFKKEFMTDCGAYKADVDELMEEAQKFEKKLKETKTDDNDEVNDDNETETENFPKVTISTDKKSGEKKKTTSTSGDTEITSFKNEDGDVVRTVERTVKGGKVLKEVEKDENGKVVKEINYKKGKPENAFQADENGRIDITYDKKGNVSKIQERDKNGRAVSVIEVTKNGYKKSIRNTDGTISQVEFNKDGKPVKKTVLNGQMKASVEEYKYSGGKKQETIKYGSDGKEASRISYEYEDYEKLPATATERKNGNKIAKYEFKYDKKGRISEEKKINNDGSYTVTEYEYDKYGRETKTVTNYDKDDNEI